MQTPKSHELDRAVSHRRDMILVHSCRSTSGALSCRRCLFTVLIHCMSGMPVQYLKQKAKATPKYHGSNCSNISLLTPTIYFLHCFIDCPDRRLKLNRASSKETLQLNADLEVQRIRVISRGGARTLMRVYHHVLQSL